jgi:hypothetical protein
MRKGMNVGLCELSSVCKLWYLHVLLGVWTSTTCSFWFKAIARAYWKPSKLIRSHSALCSASLRQYNDSTLRPCEQGCTSAYFFKNIFWFFTQYLTVFCLLVCLLVCLVACFLAYWIKVVTQLTYCASMYFMNLNQTPGLDAWFLDRTTRTSRIMWSS